MNKESFDKMNRMRPFGMHHAFETSIETHQVESFTNDEPVHHLVQRKWDDRQYRWLQRDLKNANFRYKASIEQLEYTEERGLDRNLVQRIADCSSIQKGEDLFITGNTGTGKSFLASGLGQQACLLGYKVLYTNTTKLLSQLKMAKTDGANLKELSGIEKRMCDLRRLWRAAAGRTRPCVAIGYY